MPINQEEFRALAAKVAKADALLIPLISCGCKDSHGGTSNNVPLRLTEALVILVDAGNMAFGLLKEYQMAQSDVPTFGLNMTPAQAKSLEEIRVRFGRENVSNPWLVIAGEGSIMVKANDIYIGIERDGYSHS